MLRLPMGRQLLLLVSVLILGIQTVMARPVVRHIKSTHEFDRLLKKHATETGLPVIVDFYSDGCGPCRQIAPIYKKFAKETGDKAVFVKVDTNALHELGARYQIRSLPTFAFFVGGKKVNQFSGAGEGQLRQMSQQVIRQAETENTILSVETLVEYYGTVDESKDRDGIDTVYKKCADMTKSKDCVGAAANQLVRRLKKKYGRGPKTSQRFTAPEKSVPNADEETAGNNNKSSSSSNGSTSSSSQTSSGTTTKGGSSSSSSSSSRTTTANLHLASKEELVAELEKRADDEMDAQVEDEDDDDAEFEHGWTPGDFPERVTIIGGGPAGLSAAIYAARAGLTPVVVAPPMGGQLQGKGVDVENYPGLQNVTGPGVISHMRDQAIEFGVVFEAETVIDIDVSRRPFRVITEGGGGSRVIESHSIILATGAESKWLNVPGEWDMRGNGVSSCAVCDGAVFRGKDVIVVGGGDTAMEDALVLARTSKSVTLIHRRDVFRASKVLAQRVMDHPLISIRYNATVTEIIGTAVVDDDDTNNANVDLDKEPNKMVSGAVIMDVASNVTSRMDCDAVFVAIGHTPNTPFVKGIVEFDEEHPGYIQAIGRTTRTSVSGIFAAGDVSDSVYRQAITSAGSGAAAALDAERWLSEEGLGNEAEEFEAELLADIMSSSKNERDTYNAYEDKGAGGGKVEGSRKEDVQRGEL